jgi:hypothetical protein
MPQRRVLFSGPDHSIEFDEFVDEVQVVFDHVLQDEDVGIEMGDDCVLWKESPPISIIIHHLFIHSSSSIIVIVGGGIYCYYYDEVVDG